MPICHFNHRKLGCKDEHNLVIQRAVELVGDNNALILDALSAEYAQLGDFQQAVRWQQKAVQWAEPEIKDDLAVRLELYRQGQPFREKPQGGPYRESH